MDCAKGTQSFSDAQYPCSNTTVGGPLPPLAIADSLDAPGVGAMALAVTRIPTHPTKAVRCFRRAIRVGPRIAIRAWQGVARPAWLTRAAAFSFGGRAGWPDSGHNVGRRADTVRRRWRRSARKGADFGSHGDDIADLLKANIGGLASSSVQGE
jgi:hypothetical protein